MTTKQFVELYRSLWPSGRDIDGQGFQALWEEVVADVNPKTVAGILREWRRREPFPPTIQQFEDMLHNAIGRKAERLAAKGNPQAEAWLQRLRPVACLYAEAGCGRRFRSQFERQAGGHLGTCEHGPKPTLEERARVKAILEAATKKPARRQRNL